MDDEWHSKYSAKCYGANGGRVVLQPIGSQAVGYAGFR